MIIAMNAHDIIAPAMARIENGAQVLILAGLAVLAKDCVGLVDQQCWLGEFYRAVHGGGGDARGLLKLSSFHHAHNSFERAIGRKPIACGQMLGQIWPQIFFNIFQSRFQWNSFFHLT